MREMIEEIINDDRLLAINIALYVTYVSTAILLYQA
jgi:hypothetical protein